MMLTKSQGEALTALLGTLRHDWDLPGIRAALRQAADLGPATEVAVAAVRVAANDQARTPALIPAPGPHWQGLTVGQHRPPTRCGPHPDHPALNCPECKNRPLATAEQIAQRRALARELAANPQPEPDEED